MPTLDVFPSDSKDINKYLGKIKLGQKIRITFFGSDSFVVPVLQALDENFEVAAVVTAEGSAIQNEAKKLGLVAFTPDKLDEDFTKPSYYLMTDLFVVASYGKILPQALLNIPKFGALNIHPSLLPKFRGASPVPATILSGEKTTGVTIIKMDQKMDHGPIISTSRMSLSGQEDMPTLINKLFQIGAQLIVEIIPDFIEGKLKLKPQNHSKATFTKLMKKDDGYFDIESPPSPEILDRMIRAYHPWPGVWTVWEVESAKGKVKRVVKFLPPSSHPELDSGSTKFLIQMAGKKPQSWNDFKNGYQDFPLFLGRN